MTSDDVELVDYIGQDQLPDLLGLFAHAWWTRTRTTDDVAKMLDASDLVIALAQRPTGRLLGFCRVLTDGVYLALILDVIVDPAARRLGLGNRLLNAVLTHPQLSDVQSVELVCQPDVMAFYERFGFTGDVGGSRLMRRTLKPDLVGPTAPSTVNPGPRRR